MHPKPIEPRLGTVVLGVAASDAHAVANHLIARDLRETGYDVVNLGTCTPVSEFASAVRERPDAIAVLIGSLNGHVHEDLRELPLAKASGDIHCPVVVGGNLSVGSDKSGDWLERLYALGVDHVLENASALRPLLAKLTGSRIEQPQAS
ncbi:methylaspartate mutase [Rhodococcus sp. 1R11]|uniref:cobalamin-dependent protein n=1 Tax=Rhodococcus sp. 1R11 TaxID=2559614 RepID=UPI00107168EC|nr:cobalamin-dependent protein [Rhodococcus sp. 1R11]TFI43678.1 methylaspartate mutase [Rhodococcus sp. 1R11]